MVDASEPMPENSRALVLGAGVSGLSTAFYLQRSNWSVTVLERSDRIGGVIQTRLSTDGNVIESGPSEMLVRSAEVQEILHEIGLSADIVSTNQNAKRRYITRDGIAQVVPTSFFPLITTRLWSLKARLRVLREPWISPAPANCEESVAAFTRRRLGAEFLDYAIDPLTSGIFAGDPDRLSIRHAFPRVYRLERDFGSLIRGAIGVARARRRHGTKRFPTQLISFRNGMEQLPTALANSLFDPPILRAQIKKLEPTGSGWSAEWTSAGKNFAGCFDVVVCTIPAHAIASLPMPALILDRLSPLGEIRYAPVVTVTTVYNRNDVRHPLDGFGVLHPWREKRSTLGTLFLSTLFSGRATEDTINVITFVGGTRNAHCISESDGTILERVARDHREILGVRAPPVLYEIKRWERAIPQYELGHDRFLDCIGTCEAELPGFFIHGNFRTGPAIGDCLLGGKQIAQKITDRGG